MKHKEEYKNLDRTLQLIAKQIKASRAFAEIWLPAGIESPAELFHLLKPSLIYKADPPGIELIQNFRSLMLDNYWGIPGAGDCDCFSVAAAACADVLGYSSALIVAGNGRQPTHIYNFIENNVFDLTENVILAERNYKRRELVKYRL